MCQYLLELPCGLLSLLRLQVRQAANIDGILYPFYVRGLAYLQAKQGEQAAGEFKKILTHRGIAKNSPLASLSQLQLARAEVMMGDTVAARKSYQDFLAEWKNADPDIPLLQQAKAEYAKLQ